MYCAKLTKQMLLDWGFYEVKYLPIDEHNFTFNERTDWVIKRKWRKCGKNPKVVDKVINITEAVCKHKYTSDKKYLKITFSIGNKAVSLSLARFIYVWYIGDLENGEVVDHKDNNPYNNYWGNLQKMSVGKNLAKRYIDNPISPRNQYETELYQLVHKLFESGVSYEEALEKVMNYKKGN